MNVYYNPQGVGDVLIIPIDEGESTEFTYEKHGDITKITNTKGKLLGYNIFNASEHVTINGTGILLLTEDLLTEIKTLFDHIGLDDPLEFDLTPKFVVGHVLEKEQHENADKLNVCQVDIGDETVQIVCGAANVVQNQRVVVAKVGATMPGGMKIKPTKLRGVASNGMICSREELYLPNPEDEDGIYVLGDSYSIGAPFLF